MAPPTAALFHEALEHDQQLAQLALRLFRLPRTLDALVRMLVNDDLREGLERPADGDDLGEHFRAIAIVADHLFDRGDLPGDLAQADLQRLLFRRRVRVRMAGHLPSIARGAEDDHPRNFQLASMGYGGMLHPMPDFLQALQSGAANLWIFIPTAILLGALHGLEPGHSKTMMAAFIIAIRGTIGQAVLLGLSAAISHSLVIWLLAALALHFGNQWNAESVEPYLQLGSAVCVLALAVWMFLRTRRDLRAEAEHRHHDHGHTHSELFVLETGRGTVKLSVFEDGVPPVFRLQAGTGSLPEADAATIETVRTDGTRQTFVFAAKDGFLESRDSIPEPHEFDAILTLGHAGHRHTCRAEFREGEHHHEHAEGSEFQDAHERAHAQEIEQRFAGGAVTTSQLVVFGVTGGLMPCPAAFTVLLVCLQLKRATLGFAMVGAFSFGLALTMVMAGVFAALSVRHAEKHFAGFGATMRRAPYVSCVLLVILALYMAIHGWRTLPGHG